MSPQQALDEIARQSELDDHAMNDPDTARLIINENKVLAENTVPGLEVLVKELEDGVDVKMVLAPDTVIQKPVHLCFGVIPKTGIQRIIMNVRIGARSRIRLNAHCTFPFAEDVQHIMDAEIHLDEDADYTYFERHVHSESGGITVVPKADVFVGRNARFKTEFELIRGRVGRMDIRYTTHGDAGSLVDMTARVNGKGEDHLKLAEISFLDGAKARAVLTSKVAVRDDAVAEVFNQITASGENARGHVDCKEIVLDRGRARATPIVDVRNPSAHVTHEAAVGSVDKKQLETLMSRGMDEDAASELIIQGLLS